MEGDFDSQNSVCAAKSWQSILCNHDMSRLGYPTDCFIDAAIFHRPDSLQYS